MTAGGKPKLLHSQRSGGAAGSAAASTRLRRRGLKGPGSRLRSPFFGDVTSVHTVLGAARSTRQVAPLAALTCSRAPPPPPRPPIPYARAAQSPIACTLGCAPARRRGRAAAVPRLPVHAVCGAADASRRIVRGVHRRTVHIHQRRVRRRERAHAPRARRRAAPRWCRAALTLTLTLNPYP